MFSNTLIPTYVAANVMYAHNGAETEVYTKLTTLLCDTTWLLQEANSSSSCFLNRRKKNPDVYMNISFNTFFFPTNVKWKKPMYVDFHTPSAAPIVISCH